MMARVTSVPAQSESLQPERPSVPVKKAKTLSGRGTTSRAENARLSKATTASAMLGFQSSVNRLTDVVSDRMSTAEDRLTELRTRAMQMLQVQDAELPFGERLMIQQVFAIDSASTDIYTKTPDPDMRRAFILSAAERLGIRPMTQYTPS
jgi:hypothetical protein